MNIFIIAANLRVLQSQQLRKFAGRKTEGQFPVSLVNDRQMTVMRSQQKINLQETSVGSGRLNHRRECAIRVRSFATTAGLRWMTGEGLDLETGATSHRPGAEWTLIRDASAVSGGRDLEAGNGDGMPGVRRPDRQAITADLRTPVAAAGANRRVAMTNDDGDRDPTAKSEEYSSVVTPPTAPDGGRTPAAQSGTGEAPQVVADQGRRNKVGSAEVAINMPGQVLRRVRQAANPDQQGMVVRRKKISQNPRSKPRWFAAAFYYFRVFGNYVLLGNFEMVISLWDNGNDVMLGYFKMFFPFETISSLLHVPGSCFHCH